MDSRQYLVSRAATEMLTMEEDTLDFVKQAFPMHSPADVRACVDWIETHFESVPPEYRRSLSLHIKEAADRHSLQCEGVVSMYTGEASSEMVDYCLRARGTLFPEYKKDYMKIASLPIPLEKKASVLAEMDMVSGANLLWDREIPDPWRTLFTVPPLQKVAEKEFKVLAEVITESDLRRLADREGSFLESRLGAGKTREFQSSPVSFFENASDGLKKVLCQMAISVRMEAR